MSERKEIVQVEGVANRLLRFLAGFITLTTHSRKAKNFKENKMTKCSKSLILEERDFQSEIGLKWSEILEVIMPDRIPHDDNDYPDTLELHISGYEAY